MARYDDYKDLKDPFLSQKKEGFSVLTESQQTARSDHELELKKQKEREEDNRERIKEIRKKIEKDIRKAEARQMEEKSKVDDEYKSIVDGTDHYASDVKDISEKLSDLKNYGGFNENADVKENIDMMSSSLRDRRRTIEDNLIKADESLKDKYRSELDRFDKKYSPVMSQLNDINKSIETHTKFYEDTDKEHSAINANSKIYQSQLNSINLRKVEAGKELDAVESEYRDFVAKTHERDAELKRQDKILDKSIKSALTDEERLSFERRRVDLHSQYEIQKKNDDEYSALLQGKINTAQKELGKLNNLYDKQLNKIASDTAASIKITSKSSNTDIEREFNRLRTIQKAHDENFDKTLFYSSRDKEELDLKRRYVNNEAAQDTILKQSEILKLKSDRFESNTIKNLDELSSTKISVADNGKERLEFENYKSRTLVQATMIKEQVEKEMKSKADSIISQIKSIEYSEQKGYAACIAEVESCLGQLRALVFDNTQVRKRNIQNKTDSELKKIENEKTTIKKDLASGESLGQKAEKLLYTNSLAKNYSKSAEETDNLIYKNKYAKEYAKKANEKDDRLYKSKMAKKYSELSRKADKVLYENGLSRRIGQSLNQLKAVRNRVGRKATAAIKRGLKTAFAKIKDFLLMTWTGRITLVLIIGFFAMALSLTPQEGAPVEYVSLEDCMMTSWIDVIEDSAADFYNKYHQSIPASELIPIIYTYIDEDRLNEVYGSEKANFNVNDYNLKQDYYMAVSRAAVDEFLKGMDMLSVRELFLDEVKFDTQYTNYIWSDWTTVGSTNDEVNLDNDSLDAYSSRLLDETSKHSAYKSYTSTVKTRKTVDDYGWVEHCWDERQLVNGRYKTVQVCDSSYEKVGSHTERGTASVIRYDYKNLISTEWVPNTSSLDDADKWNDNGTATWLIESPIMEDEFDSIVGMPWEFIALVNGDSGYTYKEMHYWTLRPAFTDSLDPSSKEVTGEMDDTVYHDIVYEYNPNTDKSDYLFCTDESHEHTTHVGHTKTGPDGARYTDVIALTKKVDISGTINGHKYKHEIPIELNRNIMYSYYYKLTDDTKPNEFTEMYLSQWYAKMISWAHTYAAIMETYIGNPSMLINMLDGAYYDSSAALGIWAQIRSDVSAAAKLGQRIGGADRQCTQYANWRLYKEYGIYNNYGHGKDTATHAIENSNLNGNQRLVYSKDPKAGSMFSYKSEPYGHTGWVEDYYQENGEWYIVISDGNVNNGGIRLNAKYKYSDWQAKWGSAIYYAVPA